MRAKKQCRCRLEEIDDHEAFRPEYRVVRPDLDEECDCGWPCSGGGASCLECVDSCGCLVASPNPTRRLHLERDEDVSGISGIGIVAYGVEFPDGSVVLRWDTKVRSTVFYDSLDDVVAITGHGGKTRVVLDDADSGR